MRTNCTIVEEEDVASDMVERAWALCRVSLEKVIEAVVYISMLLLVELKKIMFS